jgi:hypothetical protein
LAFGPKQPALRIVFILGVVFAEATLKVIADIDDIVKPP